MDVELISVGTELLMGNIVNTNAQYLAKQLTGLGYPVLYQSVVGDNPERLKDAVRTALNRVELVILTGGLGPTEDDITREMTAEVFGWQLSEDSTTKKRIEDYFARTGRTAPDNNWRQAMVPEGAKILENDNGTAPGLLLTAKKSDLIPEGHTAILLPGPPNELLPMFEKKVVPWLKKKQSMVLVSDMVKVCGIGESEAETMILDLIDKQTNPTIAPYAKTSEVHFRVTAAAPTKKEAKELKKPLLKELKKRFGAAIYTTKENETLEEAVVYLLKKKGMTLTTAESCTGGLIAGRIVNVAGASDVFCEAAVTYSNQAKHRRLHVKKSTLKEYGAVSEETACEMAFGAADAAKADIAVAVTGIAGPDGGTPEKPVGLVYIACACGEEVTVERHVFNGNRAKVREQTVIRALDLVRRTAESAPVKKAPDKKK